MIHTKNGLRFLTILALIILSVITACEKTEDELPDGWSEEDKASYEQAIGLQEQIGNNLDNWLQTMDSMSAIEQAYQSFLASEYVSSATINSQGITVQYANGMRGGLFINPKDEISETEEQMSLGPIVSEDDNFKSLVNQRKMILINPHYFERSFYTDQVYSHSRNNLRKVNIDLSTFYKNTEATVDIFTQLSGFGIIQIYSHGMAWPKQENITDVYLLTGETANETTSKKYWSELKEGNIPVMKIKGRHNNYFVSPQFIADNNDFTNDTILFFGGFCYSFLGGWPDIVEGFGDGAYMGYDWSVYTFKNANWSVNSIFNLSDTTANQPKTLNDWFVNSEIEKSYYSEINNRTVSIHYAGDGNLKLWDKEGVSLTTLSLDGSPVNQPGEVGVAYPFRCNVTSTATNLEYAWDIGDGSAPVVASNEVNITWSEEGSYLLSVTVKNKNSGALIGTATLTVTIGESNVDVTEFVTSCFKAGCTFRAGIQYSLPDGLWDGLSVNSVPIVWSGLSFSGIYEENSSGIEKKYTISGSLSSDGQKVSFDAREEVEESYLNAKRDFSIRVVDYPLSIISEEGINDPYAAYGSPYTGNVEVQQYVSNFEGYYISNGETYTVTGVEWDNVTMLCMMFSKEIGSKNSEHPYVQDLEFGRK